MMLFNVLALTALTATTLTFAPKASVNDTPLSCKR